MKLIDKAKVVINSNMSGTEIARDTGIDRSYLYRLRRKKAFVNRMGVANAERLGELYDRKGAEFWKQH